MAIALYDKDRNEIAVDDIIRSFHDGYTGTSWESKFYLRNDDLTRYYYNIEISFVHSLYDDLGAFGTTGWSFKLLLGETQPTENEWDYVRPGDSATIENIGTKELANTDSYYPFWIRAICPGLEPAQIRKGTTLKVVGLTGLVS